MAEVQALIDALAAAQGELKEQRAAERDGLAAQLTDIQNDMEFTPSRGKVCDLCNACGRARSPNGVHARVAEAQSTHDIAEKWNRLEESVNNRTKALEMHRKQLEDHGTHAYPTPLSRAALLFDPRSFSTRSSSIRPLSYTHIVTGFGPHGRGRVTIQHGPSTSVTARISSSSCRPTSAACSSGAGTPSAASCGRTTRSL